MRWRINELEVVWTALSGAGVAWKRTLTAFRLPFPLVEARPAFGTPSRIDLDERAVSD
jgi:hypothetical protein